MWEYLFNKIKDDLSYTNVTEMCKDLALGVKSDNLETKPQYSEGVQRLYKKLLSILKTDTVSREVYGYEGNIYRGVRLKRGGEVNEMYKVLHRVESFSASPKIAYRFATAEIDLGLNDLEQSSPVILTVRAALGFNITRLIEDLSAEVICEELEAALDEISLLEDCEVLYEVDGKSAIRFSQVTKQDYDSKITTDKDVLRLIFAEDETSRDRVAVPVGSEVAVSSSRNDEMFEEQEISSAWIGLEGGVAEGKAGEGVAEAHSLDSFDIRVAKNNIQEQNIYTYRFI